MLKSVSAVCGILLLFCACSETNNKPISIVFSADSNAVLLNHIDAVGLRELRQGKISDSVMSALVTVVETPVGIDSTFMESELPGRVLVTDSNVVFVPERPFVRGTGYLVITHLNSKFGGLREVMTGGLNPGVRPVQQLLIR